MSPNAHSRRLPAVIALAAFALLAAGCGAVAKPNGWAAPAVRNNELVYTSRDAGKLDAYRLDGSGRVWQYPQEGVDVDISAIYGNLVLLDDMIYIGSYAGNLAAINAVDGSQRWVYKAGPRVIGGLLALGDTIYAGTDEGQVVAVDRATGAERWRRAIGNEVWSTPVTDGTAIYVTSMDGNVAALNADGSTRWQRKVADGAIAGTPVLKNGVLYVGSYDRHIYALDAAGGETRWRSGSADNWFWTEPLIDGDTIYAGNMDGNVYALDLSNGTQRWKAKVGAPVRGRAAVSGGVVLVPVQNGWLWGLQAPSGEKAWEPVQVGGNLYADLAVTPSGILLASEVGKSSHKLYTVDATGRVTQIAL